MSTTKIEWTRNADGTPGKTWNPIRGCSLVSKGCTNCYAMRQAHRMGGAGQPYEGLTRLGANGPVWTGKVRCVPELLGEPLRWRKPSLVFVNSMSDLFHEEVPFDFVDQVFAVMAACPRHTFQILTKRADRMAAYVNESLRESGRWDRMLYDGRFPWPGKLSDADDPDGDVAYRRLTEEVPLGNVWLGVSVEDQARADERIPHLLETPAAVRFLSVEPMLGPVDLFCVNAHADGHTNALRGVTIGVTDGLGAATGFDHSRIDWVIVGGESGHGARPVHPEWVRSIRDQCVAAGVPFFFKQWGGWLPLSQADDDAPPPRGAPLAYLNRDGRVTHAASPYEPGCPCDHMPSEAEVIRVGKKTAGRTLDRRTWDEMPSDPVPGVT